MGDALLCFEVVYKCVIENGVLARCELFCLVRLRRLVCRVVGLILFILVGIVFLHDVAVVCVCVCVFEMHDLFVVYRMVLLILVAGCVGCGYKRWASFWSSMWDHWDELNMLFNLKSCILV
jgi:hypothetical protein